jgi:hypothetical protein
MKMVQIGMKHQNNNIFQNKNNFMLIIYNYEKKIISFILLI